MAQTMKGPKVEQALGGPLSDFPDLVQIAPLVLFTAQMTYWHAALNWQSEVLHFLSGRLRSDARLEHSFGHAATVLDLITLQQKWAASTFKDYTREWTKLFSLANRELLAASDNVSQAAE